MANTPLTEAQREALHTLEAGGMLVIDKYNCAWLTGKPVASLTRYFLTDNRLVTRLDKSRSIFVSGNGYVISEKGKKLLAGEPMRLKRGVNVELDPKAGLNP